MCSAFPPAADPLSAHPVDVGQRTEAIVLAELVRRGYRVLLPFGSNHRYDLVVDVGGRFLRIQCKTGRLRKGSVLFSAQSTRVNTQATFRRTYEGEIDYFAVYCPETGGVYAVPAASRSAGLGTLRVDPPANGQAKRIRWAADFELPA